MPVTNREDSSDRNSTANKKCREGSLRSERHCTYRTDILLRLRVQRARRKKSLPMAWQMLRSYFVSANILTGAPDPPSSLAGATTTVAPDSGACPRLATFSS